MLWPSAGSESAQSFGLGPPPQHIHGHGHGLSMLPGGAWTPVPFPPSPVALTAPVLPDSECLILYNHVDDLTARNTELEKEVLALQAAALELKNVRLQEEVMRLRSALGSDP